MTVLAEAASVSVTANTGHPLSFEPSSVAEIDGYLEEVRDQSSGSDELAELIVKFGAYLGELLVRHAGGRWSQSPSELGGWPGVVLPNEYFCDPLGKAFKRVENGQEDSVVSFYDVAVSGLPAPRRRRWWQR